MDQEAVLQEAAIRKDPYALERIQLGGLVHNPLHMAVFRGHIQFMTEILHQCPTLVLVLDHRRWSPLHLAVHRRHREIVQALLRVGPEMCGVADGDGKYPLHLAAIIGWNEGLTQLIQNRRYATLEKTTNGESILRICVKHNQHGCLELLFNTFSDPGFINVVNSVGNNILLPSCRAQTNPGTLIRTIW